MMLRVKVTPRSARSEIAGTLADGTLKIRIAAPREKGKANAELIRVLARHLKIAPEAIEIVSGHTAALKMVKIPD